jgi:hypothetical protein
MEAADDEPVALAIEDRQGEALVAAGLLERVVPNDADAPERLAQVALEDRRPGRQAVDVADNRADALEVRAEHGFEALRVAAAGDRIQPAGKAASTPEKEERGNDKDRDGDEKAPDEGIEIGADEGVQIDRKGPRAVVRV